MSKLKTILLCIVVLFAVVGVGAFAVQAMPIQTTPNKTATISVTSNIEGYSIHYAFVDNLQEKTLVDETTELMVGSDYLFYITPPSGYYLTVWGGTFGLTSEDYIPSTTGLGGVIEESAAIEFDLTFKPAVTPTITGENFITTFTNAYGEETNFLVLGQSYSVTFTADENYVLSSATFNGQSIDVTKPFMFTAQETNEFAVNAEKHIKVNVTSNVEGYEILIGDKSALDGFIFNPDSTLRFVAPSGYCFGASGITFDGLGVNLVATTVLTEKYCALSSLSLDEVFELDIILDFVPIISLNVSSENCSIIFKDSLGNVVDEFGQGLVCTLTVIPNEGYVVTESTYNGQEIDVTQPFSFAPSSTINSFVINAEKFINVNVTSNVEGYDILVSKDGARFSALNGFVLPSDSIFFMFFESPSGYCFGKRGISSEAFGATFGFSRVVQSMTSELETSRFDDVVELNIVLSFVPVVSMEISSQDCSTVFTDYSGNVTDKFGVGFEYTLTVTPNEGCVLLGATYNGQAIDVTQPFKFTAQEANEFVIDVENNSVEPEPEKSNYYFSNDYVTVSANIPGEFFTYSFRNDGVTFNIDNFSESYVSAGDGLTVKFSSLPGYRVKNIYFNYPVDCSYAPVPLIEILMLTAAALILILTKTDGIKATQGSIFPAGMQAVIAIFGIAWMGDTFINGNIAELTASIEGIVTEMPWLFGAALFVMSILLYSQAATVRAIVPLGIALGMSPMMLIALFPAVNGYFFIPNYPTVVAAINFDRTGTTGIGKYILNHSFMMPGLIATVVALAAGLLLIQLF